MKRSEKMVIYNLFPLLAGKFSNWEEHLVRAAEMGFNWIFVNPIQRPCSSGSLYSIADYFDFNSAFVDNTGSTSAQAQVKAVNKAAEQLGLKMMVDLVINHCSVDSDLLQLHPEWFARERNGHVANPFCYENGKKVIWRDLAKFEHRNTKDGEGLFRYFFSVIKLLIETGFQGFRCDAAYQVPSSLWKKLIKGTRKKYPHVKFFAETLGCPPDKTRKTAEAGFDYIFNSSKWWDFQNPWLMAQYDLTRDIAPSVSFPESHDTVRLCKEVAGNIAALKQRYLFASLFSAGVMMPIGFEFGFSKSLNVVRTGPCDWERTDIDLRSFIKNVNGIKTHHVIFQEDAPTQILSNGNPHVLLMWKGSVTTLEESLLILNKDTHNRQHFYVEDLQEFVQSGAQLHDQSPEYKMDYISTAPFSYYLQPGQGIVLTTSREPVKPE